MKIREFVKIIFYPFLTGCVSQKSALRMVCIPKRQGRRREVFDHLFKPISVNGMILKNRIIATPTGDDFEEKQWVGRHL